MTELEKAVNTKIGDYLKIVNIPKSLKSELYFLVTEIYPAKPTTKNFIKLSGTMLLEDGDLVNLDLAASFFEKNFLRIFPITKQTLITKLQLRGLV